MAILTSYEDTADYNDNLAATSIAAQGFKVAAGAVITGFSFRGSLGNTTPCTSFTAKIYEASGANPQSGTEKASESFASSSLGAYTASPTFHDFTFATPTASLTGGTTLYYLVLYPDNGTGADVLRVNYDNTSASYTNATFWIYSSPNWNESTTSDLDFKIFGNLTKSEIEHCVDDDTIALWHMNGTADSAGKKNDESANNLDLTEVNTPTAATGFDGETDGAYDFTIANSEYLSSADNAVYDLNSFTLEAWVNFDNLPGSGVYFGIAAKGGINTAISDTATQYVLWYDNDGSSKWQFGVRSTGVWTTLSYGNTPTADTWYHITVTLQASTAMKMYVNGILVATNTTSIPATLVTTAQPFVIGAMYSGSAGNYFDGLIDEVVLSSRVKSDLEISNYYSGRVSAKFYSGADDGNIDADSTQSADWTTLRGFTSGNNPTLTETTDFVGDNGASYRIDRLFLPFQYTSNLPDSLIIEIATLNLYATAKTDTNTESIDITTVTPATNGTIVAGDFDQWGTTSFNTTALTAITTNTVNIFSLNANGIANINKTGYTHFGMRINGDFDGLPVPTGANNAIFNMSESTSNKPFLWIEYTEATATSTGNFFNLF